jgi:NAD(P)-dependent dehydrogenase (short-subunit alcohol dehydrogenase family)
VAIELEGSLACVTGGARGIGHATARALAERGANVWIGDADAEAGAAAAADLGVSSYELDVTDEAGFERFVAAAEAVDGPVELLVNNAGIMPLGPFLGQDPGLSDRIIDVNLRGVIAGMRAALPGMVERGRGHVVNVASMMGKFPIAGAAVYTATKHGVVGLTHSVQEELDSTGVTLSVVLPSAVRTDLIDGVPLGRGLPVVEPDDVAAAIVASCSNGRREVYVPRWMGAYDAVDALPGPLVSVARRVLRGDRAMTSLDEGARQGYEQRIRPPEA